jgi:hypothetical protein
VTKPCGYSSFLVIQVIQDSAPADAYRFVPSATRG